VELPLPKVAQKEGNPLLRLHLRKAKKEKSNLPPKPKKASQSNTFRFPT